MSGDCGCGLNSTCHRDALTSSSHSTGNSSRYKLKARPSPPPPRCVDIVESFGKPLAHLCKWCVESVCSRSGSVVVIVFGMGYFWFALFDNLFFYFVCFGCDIAPIINRIRFYRFLFLYFWRSRSRGLNITPLVLSIVVSIYFFVQVEFIITLIFSFVQ